MDYSRIFLVFCLSLWNIVESAPVNLQSVILQNECVFPPRYLATGLQHTSDLDPCNAPIGILKTICSNITLESSCPLPKITMPSVEVTLNMYNNKQPKSDYVEQMCMYMNNLPWTLDENCTQICGEAFYVCDLYIAMDKALRNLFEKEVQADYTKIDAFIHPGQLNHLYPYPPMSSLHIPTMLDCCLKHDEATKQLCTVMAEVARMYVKTRVAVELDESHFIRNVSADWNPCSDFSSYISFSSSIDFQTLLRNCDVLCSTDMGICKMVYLGLEELSKATANRTNAAEQPSKVIGPEYQPSVDAGSPTGGGPAVVDTGNLTGGGPAVVNTGSLTGGGPAVEDTGSLTGEGPAVEADATNVIETNASQQPSQVLGLGPTDANGINTPETGAVVGSPATHTGSHTYLPTGALVGIPGTSLADLPILGNGEPTSAGEPTDTGVGNGEPTDTGVGNGEPTDTGVVNGEPTDTGVVNGETTSTVVGNGETTDTGVVNGEPTDPTVVNGGPTDTSVVNGEPTSTGVVNGGPTNTGVVNVEPASTDVGNGDSTGIVGNVEQPGSSIETPVGQNTSTDDDVVETAGNQQNEPGQTNQGVRGPAKAVYVGDDEGSDGHFMAYFLVFIVLSIAGYILFHNKQKIVALVIEGNGVKNGRRPNTNEYRQLKTEDVMPSLEKTTYSKDYVF